MTLAGRMMLGRVEMWCARRWAEATADAALSLTAGRIEAYEAFRSDARDWLEALRIVNRLRLGM